VGDDVRRKIATAIRQSLENDVKEWKDCSVNPFMSAADAVIATVGLAGDSNEACPAVLITIQNSTTDYITDGLVQVVCVDFDRLGGSLVFQADIDVALAEVGALPRSLAWRTEVLKHLSRLRKNCKQVFAEAFDPDPYVDLYFQGGGEDDDELSVSDAS
jgi:hypothetical protein